MRADPSGVLLRPKQDDRCVETHTSFIKGLLELKPLVTICSPEGPSTQCSMTLPWSQIPLRVWLLEPETLNMGYLDQALWVSLGPFQTRICMCAHGLFPLQTAEVLLQIKPQVQGPKRPDKPQAATLEERPLVTATLKSN